MKTEQVESVLEAVLDFLDDTEVPEPMPIKTEEDRKLAMGFLFWRWKNNLFE